MIPVIDWAKFSSEPEAVAKELGAVCRDHGFFLVTGHGIAPKLIADTFAAGDAFFAQDPTIKGRMAISSNPHNRGWAQIGSEKLDETGAAMDRKEAFNIGLDLPQNDPRVLAGEPFRGVNLWPKLPAFKETTYGYFQAVWALSVALHHAIARDLGLAEDYFDQHFDAPMATLRLLSYPAATGQAGEIGAGAHTDYGSLTLLMTDGEAGLQVKPRGLDWVDVPHVPGAFIVNIGDCLMRWSNNLYISTPHRVLPPKRPRRSIAFFLDPNPGSVIAALPGTVLGTDTPAYPPILASDYLRMRLDATYKPEALT